MWWSIIIQFFQVLATFAAVVVSLWLARSNRHDGTFKLIKVKIDRKIYRKPDSIKYEPRVYLVVKNSLTIPEQPFLMETMYFVSTYVFKAFTPKLGEDFLDAPECIRGFPVEDIFFYDFIFKTEEEIEAINEITSIILYGYYLANDTKVPSQIKIEITPTYRKKIIKAVKEIRLEQVKNA